MEWLNDNEIDKQKFKVLRLYAPEDELVLLDFYPLRESDEPDWNPMPEDWSCYPEPLRVYKQDYTQLLLKYFAVIYPLPKMLLTELRNLSLMCAHIIG